MNGMIHEINFKREVSLYYLPAICGGTAIVVLLSPFLVLRHALSASELLASSWVAILSFGILLFGILFSHHRAHKLLIFWKKNLGLDLSVFPFTVDQRANFRPWAIYYLENFAKDVIRSFNRLQTFQQELNDLVKTELVGVINVASDDLETARRSCESKRIEYIAAWNFFVLPSPDGLGILADFGDPDIFLKKYY